MQHPSRFGAAACAGHVCRAGAHRGVLLAVLCVLAAAVPLRAQGHDTRGHRFWVAFLENFGGGGVGELSDMRLYAASDSVAEVMVTYTETGQSITVPLPTPRTPVEINLTQRFGADIELAAGLPLSRRSIEVVANREITLYGVNVRQMSADAFLILPDDVLTLRTIVLAYPNGYLRTPDGFGRYDTPSEFCVIAIEDGTIVRIEPSTELVGSGSGTFTETLDRGEVYFGQAALGAPRDVSGTEIRATKPVAVFAGTERSSIPVHVGNYRDHLAEQMPPLEVWGREALVAPLYPITPASTEIAIVRVLAAFDNTSWSVNGVQQPPLASAVSVELPILGPMQIVASAPILVAQYEHSVNVLAQNGQYDIGDPFMMVLPPPEQYDTAYSFQSIGHWEFLHHFVNVIAPAGTEGSIRLDGRPLSGVARPIPGTRFVYVQERLGAGAHRIRGDSSFGLYAYGYGRATSYGYTGGMLFRTLVHDFQSPEIEAGADCARMSGIAFDARITDDGVDSCYALPESRNVRVEIEPFEQGADTVRFRADIVDPYRDGLAAIKAVDGGGRSRTQRTPIAGYTLRALASQGGAPVLLDSLVLFNGLTECRDLEIVNDGAFLHRIDRVSFEPQLSGVSLATALPRTLGPGERLTLRVCVRAALDIATSIRISIGDTCANRVVAVLPISLAFDTTGPILASGGTCQKPWRLVVADVGSRVSGVIRLEAEPVSNCRVLSAPTIDSAVREAVVLVEPLDEHYDAIIRLVAWDRAGNTSIVFDTLPGFTIAVLDLARDSVGLRYSRAVELGDFSVGERSCDSLVVVNFGARDVEVTDVAFANNVWVSLPPSQIPFRVPARSERGLMLCIDALSVGMFSDTLWLRDACGRIDAVAAWMSVPEQGVVGRDACASRLTVQTSVATKVSWLSPPLPNPVSGSWFSLDVALSSSGPVWLDLVDSEGRDAWSVLSGDWLAGGVHRVVVELPALSSGAYYARLRCAAGSFAQPFVVVR